MCSYVQEGSGALWSAAGNRWESALTCFIYFPLLAAYSAALYRACNPSYQSMGLKLQSQSFSRINTILDINLYFLVFLLNKLKDTKGILCTAIPQRESVPRFMLS